MTANPPTSIGACDPDRRVIGIGEWAALGIGDAVEIVTHALGSCVGVALHDPVAKIGGMMHAQMPTGAGVSQPTGSDRYVDLAWPRFYAEMLRLGARKDRLRVTLAGGACANPAPDDFFAIGKRNLAAIRKELWRTGLPIAAEDVGGSEARTMRLDLASGRTRLETSGRRKDL